MQAIKQIALTVNEKNLMQGLQHAFTSRNTLFKELLQNGDRAGATEIRLWIEEEGEGLIKAVIEDDGCGIDDMGLLLSVAESGWSDEIMATRLPYGLGFLSALYATRAIEVESKGFKVSFESKDALGFKPVLVAQHPESDGRPGTRLVLHGLKLKMSDAMGAIRSFSVGFPMRVILNGEENPRANALDAPDRHFIKTEIGMVHIPGFDTGAARVRTVYYLQGFKVYGSWEYGVDSLSNVVHLDPAKFIARMPDRDVLVDQTDRLKEIDAIISALWRETLTKKKAELPAAEFLDRYEAAIQIYAREAMNDIPLLSRTAVAKFTGQPFQNHEWDDFSANPEKHIPMEDVMNGKVLLVELEDMSDEAEIAGWNHAWARDALVVSIHKLDSKHWAMPYVLRVSSGKTEVTAEGQYAEGQASGSYIWGINVVLCESLDIVVQNEDGKRVDSVTIDDEIIYDGNRFLVPRKAEASGWAVQQASNYLGENDHYDEADMESDQKILQRKIQELRGMAPAEVLSELLMSNDIFLRDYPSLYGRSFLVNVDAEGSYKIAEQVIQQ